MEKLWPILGLSMKRALVAIGLALMLVLFAFPGTAQAKDCESTSLGLVCANIVGDDIVVSLLGQEIARINVPVKEVIVKVPQPAVTVPGPTTTIKLPGQNIPGPTATVTIT